MASVISVPKFAELKTGPERFQLIDVRRHEYATGHIPGAVNMPWTRCSPGFQTWRAKMRSCWSARAASGPAWWQDCLSHAAKSCAFLKAAHRHG